MQARELRWLDKSPERFLVGATAGPSRPERRRAGGRAAGLLPENERKNAELMAGRLGKRNQVPRHFVSGGSGWRVVLCESDNIRRVLMPRVTIVQVMAGAASRRQDHPVRTHRHSQDKKSAR